MSGINLAFAIQQRKNAVAAEQRRVAREFNRNIPQQEALQNLLPEFLAEQDMEIMKQAARLKRLENKRCVIS